MEVVRAISSLTKVRRSGKEGDGYQLGSLFDRIGSLLTRFYGIIDLGSGMSLFLSGAQKHFPT